MSIFNQHEMLHSRKVHSAKHHTGWKWVPFPVSCAIYHCHLLIYWLLNSILVDSVQLGSNNAELIEPQRNWQQVSKQRATCNPSEKISIDKPPNKTYYGNNYALFILYGKYSPTNPLEKQATNILKSWLKFKFS